MGREGIGAAGSFGAFLDCTQLLQPHKKLNIHFFSTVKLGECFGYRGEVQNTHCVDSKNDKQYRTSLLFLFFFFFLNWRKKKSSVLLKPRYLVIFERLVLILLSKVKRHKTSHTASNLVLISSVSQHGCS